MTEEAQQQTTQQVPESAPRTLEVDGRTGTIKPLTFMQSLELGPVLEPLLAGLDETIGDGSDLSGLLGAFYAHPEVLRRMLCLSTGEDEAWLESLDSETGDRLVIEFYVVNAPFFLRRITMRRMERKASEEASRAVQAEAQTT